MFWKQKQNPTGSSPSWLNETLIDENDVELPAKEQAAMEEFAELDARLKDNGIEVRNETDEERKERLTTQGKWDKWVMIGYTSVVAAAGEFSRTCSCPQVHRHYLVHPLRNYITLLHFLVVCNAFAMIAYQMGIFEIAFIIPLVTGPVVSCKFVRHYVVLFEFCSSLPS